VPRIPALLRRLTPAALPVAAVLAAAPAPALAADTVPGEVVVREATGPAKVVRVHDVGRAVARLRRRPGIRYAVPNVVARASGFVPNDPGRGAAAGGWQEAQWNFAGPAGVDAPGAWEHLMQAGHPGGRGVKVAVLDTGVAYKKRGGYRKSPDLLGTLFTRGYDFVDRDPYANDRNGHGTHVASTIAEATNNGVSLTGLAYGATIMPVRVLDDHGEGDAADIAKGVRYAAKHGARVINLSLEFSTDVTAREIPQLLDAIAYAHRKGAIIIGASGNEAVRTVAYPARADYVVSVGSTTEHGCLSDFSNQGSGLDIVAPGGGPDAVLPDPGCDPDGAPGRNIFQLTLIGSSRTKFGIPGGYQGTSMAVPHVSATAALVIAGGILGRHPAPYLVERRLERTARDLGPVGRDERYGWGLINAAAATDPAIPVT
jgi:serine protease